MASTDAYGAPAGTHCESGRKRRKGKLSGHVSLLAGPAYGKFISIEPILRRLVPALIIIFLIILGVARVFSMLAWREDIEQQHKAFLSAATANLAQMIERVANGTDAGAQIAAKDIQDTMAEFRSRGLSSSGMTLAVIDPQSSVVAISGPISDLSGKPVDTILTEAQPLFLFAERAGVLKVMLQGEPAFGALSKPMTLPYSVKHDLCGMAPGSVAQCDALRRHNRRDVRHPLRLFQPSGASSRGRRPFRPDPAPYRSGAGARSLRPVGLGHGTRSHLLVALHV